MAAARSIFSSTRRSVPGDDRGWPAEAVVQADLDLAHVRLVGQEGGAVGGARGVTVERQVVVFRLGRPVLAEIELGTEAHRPANAGVVCGGEARANRQRLIAAVEGQQRRGRS